MKLNELRQSIYDYLKFSRKNIIIFKKKIISNISWKNSGCGVHKYTHICKYYIYIYTYNTNYILVHIYIAYYVCVKSNY